MSSPTISRRRSLPHPMHSPAAPAAGPIPVDVPAPAGRYRYDLLTGGWWWSPEMFGVLDLHPDVATPTTELLISCAHPDDGPRLLQALDDSRTGRPFAVEVRTVRTDGSERRVVLVGEPQTSDDAVATAVEGICADITDGRLPGGDEERVRALQTEVLQLRTAMASRAGIEQAKGILMLLTNCSEQGAFDLLAHISSHTHRKVRDVAQTITDSATGRTKLPDDIAAILRDACPPSHTPHAPHPTS